MDNLNEGITYVFGENAAIDGNADAQWVVDFFYNKDTPLFDDIFEKMRELLWGLVRNIILKFQ